MACYQQVCVPVKEKPRMSYVTTSYLVLFYRVFVKSHQVERKIKRKLIAVAISWIFIRFRQGPGRIDDMKRKIFHVALFALTIICTTVRVVILVL
jgi:hypothetical protein